VSWPDAIAASDVDNSADGWVNSVRNPVPAGAKKHGRITNVLRFQFVDVAGAVGGNGGPVRRGGQARIVIDHAWVASLLFNQLPESVQRLSADQSCADTLDCLRVTGRRATQAHHVRGDVYGQAIQVAGSPALEGFQRFDHFE